MKWNYLKGSEKDFEGAPEWATVIAEGEICAEAWKLGSRWGSGIDATYTEMSGGLDGLLSREVIAQREPISTPKHMMIFGDPKSFIFAHKEATHAAKNKVTGEVVHTHIPGLINLSKFDFIAQRQLTDVTEGDLNECIGASEAIAIGEAISAIANSSPIQVAISRNNKLPHIPIKAGALNMDGKTHSAQLGGGHKLKLSGHFKGNGFAAKLESKHLSIKIASNTVGITYSARVFSASEIAEATECIKKLNEIVNKSSMEFE